MNEQQMAVKLLLDGWHTQVKAMNGTLAKLTDEQLMQEIAPGKNRGIYLLGHMAAVHDLMLPLLRFEEAMYPELKPVFIVTPDRAVAELPAAAELREKWNSVNERLNTHISNLPMVEWFTRHASVSPEDFAKEPHRNRLGVLQSRTTHMAYHNGQLALLISKG